MLNESIFVAIKIPLHIKKSRLHRKRPHNLLACLYLRAWTGLGIHPSRLVFIHLVITSKMPKGCLRREKEGKRTYKGGKKEDEGGQGRKMEESLSHSVFL